MKSISHPIQIDCPQAVQRYRRLSEPSFCRLETQSEAVEGTHCKSRLSPHFKKFFDQSKLKMAKIFFLLALTAFVRPHPIEPDVQECECSAMFEKLTLFSQFSVHLKDILVPSRAEKTFRVNSSCATQQTDE